MTDRRSHIAPGNFTGIALKIASALLGVAVTANSGTAAAQGAGPYYEDDSVVVDLTVLDDGGRGKRPGMLPPAGVVPGSSRGLMMPGTEAPRSQFHGLGGVGATPQASTKATPPKRTATAKSRPAEPKAEPTPTPAPRVAARTEPPPKPAPIARVTTQPAEPPISTTPPPPPPISVPTPLPPAPVAAAPSTATETAAATAPATPPAAPTLAPVQAPTAPPPPMAVLVAPPALAPVPASPTTTGAPAPAAPLSIAPPPSVASVPVPPSTPPQPAAKPAEPPVAAPSQAALPPAGDPVMQISFPTGESRVPADIQNKLKDLAERMKAQESLRMQLVAYATGDDLSASAARRLSLSRALAVRTFLIDNGVRSTRIDVRALGDKAPDKSANRVDVSISER